MSLYDLSLASTIIGLRNKGNLSEFTELMTDYRTPADGIQATELFRHLHDEVVHPDGVFNWILDLEMQLIDVLARMEGAGIRLDTEKLRSIGDEITSKMVLLEQEIYEVSGEFFNINSPKQVAELLFGKLGLKPRKKTKTGYSVDTEVLEELKSEAQIAGMILEYRLLAKLNSTYVEALIKSAHKRGGILHTTYQSLGAATGRMSSTDPNLQNIPTGSGYPDAIKSCFVPRDEDHILLVADYSQIELRVLAWLSSDPSLLSAFQNGEDIHARTARFLFGKDHDITSEERRIAKTVNFGVIYGITGYGLSKTLSTSPAEATQYINAFYERYPGVRTYYDGLLEQAHATGYVETIFGRRREIALINDANKTIRSMAEREAINMPIQGTAADLLKIAMIHIDMKIRELGLESKMILQVHDELVFDVLASEQEVLSELVRSAMESVVSDVTCLDVKHCYCPPDSYAALFDSHRIPPFRVDIHVGMNWSEAKG